MDNDEFLKLCSTIGVSAIQPPNHKEEGFRVVFKNGYVVYVLFKQEYGESWMDYETEEKYNDRWNNIKTLSDEEYEQYNEKILETMKNKYSSENFSTLIKHLKHT